MPPATNAVLGKMLDALSATSKYYVEYDKFLSSHLLCGMVGLRELGADGPRIERFVELYSTKLEPHTTHGFPVAKTDARVDIAPLVGKRIEYYTLLQEYERRFNACDRNLAAFMKDNFPPLSDGVSAALLHGLINIGYSIRSGHDASVVEAVAYLHHSHRGATYKSPVPPLATFGTGKLSLVDVAAEMRSVFEDKLLPTQVAGEKRMRDPEYGWHSSTPQYRIYALLQEGDMMMKFVNDLAVPEDVIARGSAGISRWLLEQSVLVYELAAIRNDFVLIHGVTSVWSLHQVLPMLSEHDALEALRNMTLLFLCVFATQGCPDLADPAAHAAASPLRATEEAWEELSAKVLARDTDEHVYKLIAICKELWMGLSTEERKENWLYFTAANDCADNELGWVKYHATQAGDGVMGIRDNSK